MSIIRPGDKVRVLKSRIAEFKGKVATVHRAQENQGSRDIRYYFPDDPALQALILREAHNDYWTTDWEYAEIYRPNGLYNDLGSFPKKKR